MMWTNNFRAKQGMCNVHEGYVPYEVYIKPAASSGNRLHTTQQIEVKLSIGS